ncbi:MAG: hypothetical protein M3P95_12080, partial [Actinomycetota bacterium]|nr:hypothetical protein [Actinomycetota bacterium]
MPLVTGRWDDRPDATRLAPAPSHPPRARVGALGRGQERAVAPFSGGTEPGTGSPLGARATADRTTAG